MREIRPSGLEGGETQLNASSLPLSLSQGKKSKSTNERSSPDGLRRSAFKETVSLGNCEGLLSKTQGDAGRRCALGC